MLEAGSLRILVIVGLCSTLLITSPGTPITTLPTGSSSTNAGNVQLEPEVDLRTDSEKGIGLDEISSTASTSDGQSQPTDIDLLESQSTQRKLNGIEPTTEQTTDSGTSQAIATTTGPFVSSSIPEIPAPQVNLVDSIDEMETTDAARKSDGKNGAPPIATTESDETLTVSNEASSELSADELESDLITEPNVKPSSAVNEEEELNISHFEQATSASTTITINDQGDQPVAAAENTLNLIKPVSSDNADELIGVAGEDKPGSASLPYYASVYGTLVLATFINLM